MAENSKIEWCETTWNPTTGCTRASAGCDNCYAFTMTKRLAAMGQDAYQGLAGNGHFNGVVKMHEDRLRQPLHWRKPRLIFVNSMSDLFHANVPFEFVDKVFAVMALCEQHTFQVLTKRPERMAEYTLGLRDGKRGLGRSLSSIGEEGIAGRFLVMQALGVKPCSGGSGKPPYQPLTNAWLGTSCEDQETANQRLPHLSRCEAAVRFVSCEPLLGPVDLECIPRPSAWPRRTDDISDGIDPLRYTAAHLDWVIIGAESGPHARPMKLDWARRLVDQCRDAGVACFVKQLCERGRKIPFDRWPEDLRVREYPSPVGATP